MCKVTFEDVGTLELNLPARRLICGQVAQLGAISETDSHGWNDAAHMTALRVSRVSQGSRPAVLGLPVALVDVDAESKLVELEDLGRDGSRCGDHVLDPPTELLAYLLEDDLVI